jgi:hypothetical protein
VSLLYFWAKKFQVKKNSAIVSEENQFSLHASSAPLPTFSGTSLYLQLGKTVATTHSYLFYSFTELFMLNDLSGFSHALATVLSFLCQGSSTFQMVGSCLYKPDLSSCRKKNYRPNPKSNLTYWATTCNVTFHQSSSTEMFLMYKNVWL